MNLPRLSRAIAAGLLLGAALVLITVIGIVMEDSPLLPSVRARGVLLTRDQIMEAMVESIPRDLPSGAIAVLQPDLPSPELVDDQVVPTWTASLIARIRDLRPALELTSREHLEAILREQRFSTSGYVRGGGRVQAGRLLAARMLLLSEVKEFKFAGAGVQVALDAQLLDVETGSVIWSHTRAGGIFPPWPRPVRFLAITLVIIASAIALLRYVRTCAARRAWGRWARVRSEVDSLTKAATSTRTRYLRQDLPDIAHVQQRAWIELDTALDLVRLTSQPAQSAPTAGLVKTLSSTILRLESACENPPPSRRAGLALAEEYSAGAGAIRGLAKHLSPLMG